MTSKIAKPERDNVALLAWTVSYLIIGVSCGASGAMALYLTSEETTLALTGWGAAVAFGVLIVEPVWIVLVVCVGSAAGCMRRCLERLERADEDEVVG